jgi:hypothetical protein
MKIFESKNNGKKYTIEILQSPFPFLDGLTRLGVYAYPYYWEGKVIFFKSTDFEGRCKDWINENFVEIAER